MLLSYHARKLCITTTILIGLLINPVAVMGQSASLDDLLKQVKQLSQQDQKANKAREARFLADLNQQKQLLAQSEARLQAADEEQHRLKQAFDKNEDTLTELETLLQQRSGQLGEVFGVAKEVAAELRPILDDSMVSAAIENRTSELSFADQKSIPNLQQLRELWYQMQLEMTAAGKIQLSTQPVIDGSGNPKETEILRVGVFTAATTDGQFLDWNVPLQQWHILPTQPGHAAQTNVQQYVSGQSEQLLVDPSRGQLMQLLDQIPSIEERLHQGGEVGYLILALGLIGLLVAAWRLLCLLVMEVRVKSQLRSNQLSQGNPLGRVLSAAKSSGMTLTALEMKVEEAILGELPRLERGQSIIKLLAAVAPLLGLLGTVVGMIATFQSITLFGTGDPKLMAGGISQALMTTVLGLVVAVPLLFSHSLLSARGRRLQQILQEKSLAVLAQESSNDSQSMNSQAVGQGVHRVA